MVNTGMTHVNTSLEGQVYNNKTYTRQVWRLRSLCWDKQRTTKSKANWQRLNWLKCRISGFWHYMLPLCHNLLQHINTAELLLILSITPVVWLIWQVWQYRLPQEADTSRDQQQQWTVEKHIWLFVQSVISVDGIRAIVMPAFKNRGHPDLISLSFPTCIWCQRKSGQSRAQL